MPRPPHSPRHSLLLAGVCLSAKLRKDSAKGHAAASAAAEGVGARTLFYALHALRRKVLIGSTPSTHQAHTKHTLCPLSPPPVCLPAAHRDCCISSTCHKTAAKGAAKHVDRHNNSSTSSRLYLPQLLVLPSPSLSHSLLLLSPSLPPLQLHSLPRWTSIKRGHIESTENNCFLNGFYAICVVGVTEHLPRPLGINLTPPPNPPRVDGVAYNLGYLLFYL